jgi:outer membrane protein TolC
MGPTLALLVAVSLAPGQGVPLPPLSRIEQEKDKAGTLPPPRPIGKPLVPPTLGGPSSPGTPVGQPIALEPLQLHDVLRSVDRHYPLVRAAEQERVIAAGGQLAAQGAFDHVLRSLNYAEGGSFANQRYNVFVEQQTPYWGISYFAGYRLGLGSFPVYYGDRKTADGGEFRAGVLFPLLRGREIDPFRATLAKANIDRALAEPNIELQRIDIARMASFAYWQWLATGQRLLIARDILRIAEVRDDQLGKRVKAGNLAPIEQEDNRRIIIDRQARLVAAQRGFQQASILLSLYLRDEAGSPVIPTQDQLPAFAEPTSPPDLAQRQRDLEMAIGRRPEIQRLVLQRQKVQVDRDLAENQLLPGLNFGVIGAQDVGQAKKDLDGTFGQLALLFDVPLERRTARGRILLAQGELARLLAQEQFARDRVQVEVQNALNGLDRAYDLLRRGRDNRLQNDYLREAEVRQFDVGKSDLFRVNIRELNAAEARFLEIDAVAEFFRALAEYYAALGIDMTKQPR